MAAKLGSFGESTDITQTTTTLYTVPTDKASRVRCMYAVEGGTGQWECGIIMGPGDEILIHSGVVADGDTWTGSEAENTIDPTGSVLSRVNGIMATTAADQIDISDCNSQLDFIIAPLDADYFLSEADTVKFILTGSNGTDGYIQVGGVEDDA